MIIDFVRVRSDKAESGFVWVYETPSEDETQVKKGHGPFDELAEAVIDSNVGSSPVKITDDLYRYDEGAASEPSDQG